MSAGKCEGKGVDIALNVCYNNNVVKRDYEEAMKHKEKAMKKRGAPHGNQNAKKTTFATKINATLEKFLQSEDFSAGVVSSTKASWGGSGYSVELFEDDTWRVLWNNEIGNLYVSPGMIMRLPTLDDSDYHDAINGEGSYSMPVSEEDWFYAAFEAEGDDLAQELRDELHDREVMAAMAEAE